METAILETKQLIKTYPTDGMEVNALRGVDLKIRAGELVAVMGPSGSGKSTLLHILGGLDRPTAGEVYITDRRIDLMNEAKRSILRRQTVGFVFQAFNLIGNLNVKDNVELPALVAGSSARQARQRRQELLSNLGIEQKARNAPAQLSGGEKQRVALARALVNHPAILLADEPTGNLDTKTAMEVLRLLRQTHTEGQTILMVTHDPTVASIAQRVIFMQDGMISREVELKEKGDTRSLISEMLDWEG
jgi:putative ABC transport system ATP-binding protein